VLKRLLDVEALPQLLESVDHLLHQLVVADRELLIRFA
jgi:hypothetical protein